MPDTISGHLQLKGPRGSRRWYALWRDEDGRHQKALGPAHAKDSGRRTSRGAIVWRAADGPRPTPAHLTPEDARQALAALLAEVRTLGVVTPAPSREVRTLADARDEWLRHIEFDRQRKRSTVMDYRGQSRRYLLDEFGARTPLDEITTEAIEEWQQRLQDAADATAQPTCLASIARLVVWP